MTAPTPTLQNIVVGQAMVYTAPAPLRVPEPRVLDTLAQGTLWTGNWVYIGATSAGATIADSKSNVNLTIEEQANPADVITDTQQFLISCLLSEETAANMKLAFGAGSITTTAPGTTQVGKTTLTLSDTMDYLSAGFETINAFGFWTRAYVPLVKSTAKLSIAYRRAKSQRLWNLELTAICPTSSIVIDEMTAVHT